MQFDGLAMRACLDDLRARAHGARLQRVSQLTALTLSLQLWAGKSHELIVCAEPDAACIVLAREPRPPTIAPTAFCSAIRRSLGGKRLVAVDQKGWDRIARLTFSGRDELGDIAEYVLTIETMGKHSNVICLRPDGRIVDALKRVGRSRSRVRQVLPGLAYEYPPGQIKVAPDEATAQQLRELLAQGQFNLAHQLSRSSDAAAVARLLMAGVEGLGPARASSLAAAGLASLHRAESHIDAGLAPALAQGLADLVSRTPAEQALEAQAVEALFRGQYANSPGAGEDTLHAAGRGGRLAAAAAPGSGDEQSALRATTRVAAERSRRRLRSTQEQLANISDPDYLRRQADGLLGALAQAREVVTSARQAGQATTSFALPLYETYREVAETDDGLSPAGSGVAGLDSHQIVLELDTRHDPAETAQELYAQYASAKRSRTLLKGLIQREHIEFSHLAALEFQLGQELSPEEYSEVKTEAIAAGVQLPLAGKVKSGAAGDRAVERPGGPRKYTSPSGLPILAGRNNRQNEYLLRQGAPDDVWFHARGVAGAHVLLRTSGRSVSDTDMEYAASIAAYHSQAHTAGRVAVDTCPVQRLRKPKGAPPGFVTYTGERTLYVAPRDGS